MIFFIIFCFSTYSLSPQHNSYLNNFLEPLHSDSSNFMSFDFHQASPQLTQKIATSPSSLQSRQTNLSVTQDPPIGSLESFLKSLEFATEITNIGFSFYESPLISLIAYAGIPLFLKISSTLLISLGLPSNKVNTLCSFVNFSFMVITSGVLCSFYPLFGIRLLSLILLKLISTFISQENQNILLPFLSSLMALLWFQVSYHLETKTPARISSSFIKPHNQTASEILELFDHSMVNNYTQLFMHHIPPSDCVFFKQLNFLGEGIHGIALSDETNVYKFHVHPYFAIQDLVKYASLQDIPYVIPVTDILSCHDPHQIRSIGFAIRNLAKNQYQEPLLRHLFDHFLHPYDRYWRGLPHEPLFVLKTPKMISLKRLDLKPNIFDSLEKIFTKHFASFNILPKDLKADNVFLSQEGRIYCGDVSLFVNQFPNSFLPQNSQVKVEMFEPLCSPFSSFYLKNLFDSLIYLGDTSETFRLPFQFKTFFYTTFSSKKVSKKLQDHIHLTVSKFLFHPSPRLFYKKEHSRSA